MAKNFKYDPKKLDLAISKTIEANTFTQAKKIAKAYFNEKKMNFLQEIYDSEVGIELTEADSFISSDFIISNNPVNLFGFLGFVDGTDPIGNLLKYLNDNIKLNVTTKKIIKNTFIFNVEYPSLAAIKMATPLPWTNRSWITAIEKGLSNIGYYIYQIRKQGRSGKGTQVKYEIGNKEFTPVKFFTPVYEDFVKAIKKKVL